MTVHLRTSHEDRQLVGIDESPHVDRVQIDRRFYFSTRRQSHHRRLHDECVALFEMVQWSHAPTPSDEVSHHKHRVHARTLDMMGHRMW